MLLHILVGILAGIGVYFILADALRIPYLKTSAAVMNLTKNQKEDVNIIEVWLSGLASKLAKVIRMNEFKRADLLENLRTAQLDLTPEQYQANALVKALFCGMLVACLGFILSFFFAVAVVTVAVVYVFEMKKVEGRLRAKREQIEFELPRLVFNIEKTLKHSRDVIAMLATYEPIAGPAMKDELAITLADMRSGNYETAITRLEIRSGSPLMSDVCRGLISILRGDRTEAYWSMLSAKFSEIQRQQLRLKAKKIPPKVHRISMLLLFCFLLEYIVAIGVQMYSSLTLLFG